MKRVLSFILLSVWVAATAQSPYTYTAFPAFTATATSQTSPAYALSLKGATKYSYSAGSINVVGSALTTATFAVLGSQDNGVTYNALVIQACGVHGGSATTATVTANGCYWVALPGIDHVELQTSGTFTATSVTLTLRAEPNVQAAAVMPPAKTYNVAMF